MLAGNVIANGGAADHGIAHYGCPRFGPTRSAEMITDRIGSAIGVQRRRSADASWKSS
jgi:hypothetical protein